MAYAKEKTNYARTHNRNYVTLGSYTWSLKFCANLVTVQFSIIYVASVYKLQSILRNLDLKITKGELNIPQKLLTSSAQRDKTLQETFTFTDKSKSLLVIQIKEAIGEN